MDQLTPQNPNSIQNMFGAIAGKYDLANTVLSMGIHHLWKNALVRKSGAKPGDNILDCATGTGDLAFRFEAVLRGQGSVVGSDFCEPMLEIARAKATQQGSKASFVVADAMKLPFENSKFDIASISFGIRNIKDTTQALNELGRVVKPGGRVLVLEFGQPKSTLMANLFGFYSNSVLPRLGGWISGQSQAYRYLQTSSSTFPCGEDFLNIARSTGKFTKLDYRTFQNGIAYLYCLER
ncbi:MAG: bifunctional demethylmenaquinone methyltransferase/2-methoxy-6-polyprenyl-1,4-benzoquinol methylase UbiE [Bdellovibrionia bacterium]